MFLLVVMYFLSVFVVVVLLFHGGWGVFVLCKFFVCLFVCLFVSGVLVAFYNNVFCLFVVVVVVFCFLHYFSFRI